MVITKRSQRLKELSIKIGGFPSNLAVGVTVENRDYYFRIKDLQEADVYRRHLFLKPLLGPMPDLPLDKIVEVRASTEFNSIAPRCPKPAWSDDIHVRCLHNNIDYRYDDDSPYVGVGEPVVTYKLKEAGRPAKELASGDANLSPGKSAQKTASIVGVSQATVERARTVLADPEEKQAVLAGKNPFLWQNRAAPILLEA